MLVADPEAIGLLIVDPMRASAAAVSISLGGDHRLSGCRLRKCSFADIRPFDNRPLVIETTYFIVFRQQDVVS